MSSIDIAIPKEEDEQMAFVNWCQAKKYKVHHCANEVGGGSWALKSRAIKAKRMGTSKGFPDLLVFIPVENIDGEVDSWQMIAIEMKRRKGGVVSKEQKEWGEILQASGVPFKICYGCEQAINFIQEVVGKIYED